MNLFEKNIEALRKIQPHLASRLEEKIWDRSHLEVLRARDGAWTLRARGEQGNWVLLHSLESPMETARERVREYLFEDYSVTVLFGFGMGYLAEAIAERMEDQHRLIIYEADPAIVQTAFQYRDFSHLFERRRVFLQVGEEVETREWLIGLVQNIMANRLSYVEYKPALNLHPTYYTRIRDAIDKFYEVVRMDVRTMTYVGKVFVKNFLENLLVLATSRGVRCLKGIARGVPILIISAGPSLERNFHHLKRAKGKAILIAVDTIVRFLMANDIVPDFVVALDYKQKNLRKFENIDLRGSRLVFTGTACPEILKRFGGEVFGMSAINIATGRRFVPFLGDIGRIPPGQSVGNFAFELALYMKGSPIAFVGQDMAFEPESLRKYTDGVPTDWTNEGKQFLDDVDIFGRPVKTFVNYKNIQTVLEYQIQQAKEEGLQVYNATEAGLGMAGAENVRLEDFVDRFCTQPVDIESRILEDAQRGMDLDGLIQEMEKAIRNLRELHDTSRKILQNIRKVQRSRDEGRRVRLSQILEAQTQKISKHSDEIQLFRDVAFDLHISMHSKEMMAIDQMEDEEARLSRQLERGKVYYQRMAKEIPPFLSILRRSLQKVRLLREFMDREARATHWEELCRVGEGYLEIGLYREARRVFERVCQREASSRALAGWGKALLGVYALPQAEGILQEAARKDPGNREIPHLLQACRSRWEAWRAERQRIQKTPKGQAPGREGALQVLDFYLQVKNPEWGEAALRRLQEALSEEDWPVFLQLCQLYEERGDGEGCLRVFEQALERYPDRAEFYKALGRLLIQLGEVQQAIPFFLEAVERGLHGPQDLEEIGDLLLEAGAYPQAALFYESALEQAPQQLSCAAKAAQAYQQMIQATLH